MISKIPNYLEVENQYKEFGGFLKFNAVYKKLFLIFRFAEIKSNCSNQIKLFFKFALVCCFLFQMGVASKGIEPHL